MAIEKRYKLETYKTEKRCDCGFLLRVADYIPYTANGDNTFSRPKNWIIHRCSNCGKEEAFDKEYPYIEKIWVEVE